MAFGTPCSSCHLWAWLVHERTCLSGSLKKKEKRLLPELIQACSSLGGYAGVVHVKQWSVNYIEIAVKAHDSKLMAALPTGLHVAFAGAFILLSDDFNLTIAMISATGERNEST